MQSRNNAISYIICFAQFFNTIFMAPSLTVSGQFTPRQFNPRQFTPGQFTLGKFTPGQFTPDYTLTIDLVNCLWVGQFTPFWCRLMLEYVNNVTLCQYLYNLPKLPALIIIARGELSRGKSSGVKSSPANSQLGLLLQTCHSTMSTKQKKTFYFTIVTSIFKHCSVISRPKSSNQISKFCAI